MPVVIRSLPPLYKQSPSTGKILFWRIFVTDSDESPDHAIIATEYGQLDGQPMHAYDVIRVGKNVGRANETSAEEQAFAEAKSRWTKKRDRGYVESVDDATRTQPDFTAGVDAMLAHVFTEHSKKMTYPCAVQPKLDGIRCLAVVQPSGEVMLWTRNKKRINSVPNIEHWLFKLVGEIDDPIVFDGELYNHRSRDNFEVITSIVRQSEPSPRREEVEYHIYDLIDPASGFDLRLRKLLGLIQGDVRRQIYRPECPIRVVETILARDQEDLLDQFSYFRKMGYEGAMARRLDTPYEGGKRSYSLLKLKTFTDDEFRIIDIEEGRGKLAGHVGAFICKTKEGKTFKAKMEGDTAKLKEYFEHPDLWAGKFLTVRFQNLTDAGVPRFPVGVRFRDEQGD
jgi:DNA ligase-1